MVTMRSIHPAWLAIALALLSASAGQRAMAQEAKNTLHIGILSSGSLELRMPLDAALVEGLRARGYVEGKNLVIERRYGASRVSENATELAGMKLDAILTTCTPSTRVMKAATASTPIVMAAVSDPVQQGLIASLSRPGRNVTGTSSQAEELLAKIKNGGNPAVMPVEQPTRFELVVNMKTARALGIVVPQSLLLRADEVIQ